MYPNKKEVLASAAKAPEYINPVFKTEAGLDEQVRALRIFGDKVGVIYIWCDETKHVRNYFVDVAEWEAP